MAIVVDPRWSFEEALEAAWKQYRGIGPELGVSSRVRFLNQWANVVGAETATRQLEDALKKGLLAEEFSKSTIYRMRKAFRGMPKGASTLPPRDLQQTLRWIAAQHYENETDFLAKAVPTLARALGWGDDQVFFETRLPGEMASYADAILASTRTSKPRVLIQAGLRHSEPGVRLRNRLRMFLEVSGTPTGVLLYPDELVVADALGERAFGLHDISREDAEQLQALLRNPGGPVEPEPLPAPGSTDAKFEALLQAVDAASNNDEKKKSLETLAAALVKGMPAWRCKYADLRTKSAEIDIVVEQGGASPPALLEFGRYALVECKNWQKPVDAKALRDFIGKMRSAKVRLGIVFSMKGVTGEEHGADALREIQRAYSEEERAVVVISRDDFRACADPEKFLKMVDERIDKLRFDL